MTRVEHGPAFDRISTNGESQNSNDLNFWREVSQFLSEPTNNSNSQTGTRDSAQPVSSNSVVLALPELIIEDPETDEVAPLEIPYPALDTSGNRLSNEHFDVDMPAPESPVSFVNDELVAPGGLIDLMERTRTGTEAERATAIFEVTYQARLSDNPAAFVDSLVELSSDAAYGMNSLRVLASLAGNGDRRDLSALAQTALAGLALEPGNGEYVWSAVEEASRSGHGYGVQPLLVALAEGSSTVPVLQNESEAIPRLAAHAENDGALRALVIIADGLRGNNEAALQLQRLASRPEQYRRVLDATIQSLRDRPGIIFGGVRNAFANIVLGRFGAAAPESVEQSDALMVEAIRAIPGFNGPYSDHSMFWSLLARVAGSVGDGPAQAAAAVLPGLPHDAYQRAGLMQTMFDSYQRFGDRNCLLAMTGQYARNLGNVRGVNEFFEQRVVALSQSTGPNESSADRRERLNTFLSAFQGLTSLEGPAGFRSLSPQAVTAIRASSQPLQNAFMEAGPVMARLMSAGGMQNATTDDAAAISRLAGLVMSESNLPQEVRRELRDGIDIFLSGILRTSQNQDAQRSI